jgi:hypothetical protein
MHGESRRDVGPFPVLWSHAGTALLFRPSDEVEHGAQVLGFSVAVNGGLFGAFGAGMGYHVQPVLDPAGENCRLDACSSGGDHVSPSCFHLARDVVRCFSPV